MATRIFRKSLIHWQLILCLGIPLIFTTAGTVDATIVRSYDAGVVATAGAGGANDPASVAGGSWNAVIGTGFRAGIDSGNGGWRITDGSGSGTAPHYDTVLSASDLAKLDNSEGGWELTFRVSMPGDAIGQGGAFSNDYYANTPTLQNNNLILIENAGDYRFNVQFTSNPAGNMVVNGFEVGGGISMNDEISDNSGTLATPVTVEYVDFALRYTGGTTAILTNSVGDPSLTVNSAAASQNRIYWGSGSGSGQGSTIWNNIQLRTIVPEPSSLVLCLFGFAGVMLTFGRRQRFAKR